jgi:uncharacterized membrane protein YphA (DoxX/SURF4 family)
MKALLNLSRIIVGILFIFSGLVKANDPMGLSYKMQEFFEVWGLHALNDYTLLLSLVMNAFEIVAGVAVLLGWRMRLFSWLLLLLIIFFTFLTGYALLSGKIKTCGCFGDCIPLTPLQSFIKDLLLLVLILFIFVKRKLVHTFLPPFLNGTLILLVVLFCIASQYYVLKHLPIVDCLPYKAGNNLLQQMQPPANAVSDSFEIRMKYKVNGKEVEFDMNNFPEDFNDSTYEFIDRYQKLVRKGTGGAPIADFVLFNVNNADTTQAILNQQGKYILLFVKDASKAGNNWIRNATAVAEEAAKRNMPVFVVTATLDEARSQLYNVNNITFLRGDATVIKTAARVNPTYFVMKGADVVEKIADTDHEEVIALLRTEGKN